MSVLTFATHRLFSSARARAFDLSAAHITRLRALWPLFVSAGATHKLSPYLLAGIAWGESQFIATAKNASTGAAGIMQVMPGHFGWLGWSGTDWQLPSKNIPAGARILADQLRSRKSIEKALAGYGGFTSWLAGKAVSPGGPQDANWYIDEALGRAFLLELMNLGGRLELSAGN